MANDLIKFGEFEIRGTFSPLIPSAPTLHVRRSYFWGTRGETEIVSGRGGRNIVCNALIHEKKFKTWKILIDWLLTLDKQIGEHGKLSIAAGHDVDIKQEFANCTFEGFEWVGLAGQKQPGPLKDEGKSLRESAADEEDIWFINGALRWRQLADVP